jgi:2-dehydro-3-deoxygluconokinase
MSLTIKPKSQCRWDFLSLGEVMLRLDPGEGRIQTSRNFHVWEVGGECNVARGLRRCFGLETTIVTALAENPVGRLVQDLIYCNRSGFCSAAFPRSRTNSTDSRDRRSY